MTTGTRSASARGNEADTADVRLQTTASKRTSARGGGAGHSAGAASATERTGVPRGGALDAVSVCTEAPTASEPSAAMSAVATPRAASVGPAAQLSVRTSPGAGSADRYTAAAAGGSASERSSRRTPVVARSSGGPADAASNEPSADGAYAATAGSAGGKSAASSFPQWTQGGVCDGTAVDEGDAVRDPDTVSDAVALPEVEPVTDDEADTEGWLDTEADAEDVSEPLASTLLLTVRDAITDGDAVDERLML